MPKAKQKFLHNIPDLGNVNDFLDLFQLLEKQWQFICFLGSLGGKPNDVSAVEESFVINAMQADALLNRVEVPVVIVVSSCGGPEDAPSHVLVATKNRFSGELELHELRSRPIFGFAQVTRATMASIRLELEAGFTNCLHKTAWKAWVIEHWNAGKDLSKAK